MRPDLQFGNLGFYNLRMFEASPLSLVLFMAYMSSVVWEADGRLAQRGGGR